MPWYLCYSPCKGRIRLSVHFLTTYYSLLANTYFSLELRTPQSNCPALPVLSMGGVEDLREVDLVAGLGIPRGGVVRQSVPATGCETEERAADVAVEQLLLMAFKESPQYPKQLQGHILHLAAADKIFALSNTKGVAPCWAL